MVSKVVSALSPELQQFIEEQPEYSPRQHAAWRIIRSVGDANYHLNALQPAYKQSVSLLSISSERVPRISEMDLKLDRIGFGCIGVNGFIPPQAFMEFQRRGVLPISIDMRDPSSLTYTPSPDIVHECWGHLAMLADEQSRQILNRFGTIASKAQFSVDDQEYFDATRHMSALELDPRTSSSEKEEGLSRLLEAQRKVVENPSEAAQLASGYWYTVEFGLLGSMDDPKIYGAGLISSFAEGKLCLMSAVEKLPFSIETFQTPYYITEPQNRLFVARDLDHILEVLDEFASMLSDRTDGGLAAIVKPTERIEVEMPYDAELNDAYTLIENARNGTARVTELMSCWRFFQEKHADEWLGPLFILEILHRNDDMRVLQSDIFEYLDRTKTAALTSSSQETQAVGDIINDGLQHIVKWNS